MKASIIIGTIIFIVIIFSCIGKNQKKGGSSEYKTTFSIEEKHFLERKIDSTIIYRFNPGDTISNDLDSSEIVKFILTKDAAHKYKLIAISKKSDSYISIVVLYIWRGVMYNT